MLRKELGRRTLSRIYLITSNRHKVEEASIALKPFGIEVKQLPIKRLEIQSDDLVEIAIFSLREVINLVNERPLVVEDAGLFIPALKGFPGPYSSFVYKTIGCQGILKLMKDIDDRRAYFKSVVVYYDDDVGMKVFEGTVWGRIATEIRGSQGFGFDPIFVPEGSNKTFAEMGPEEKTKYSHRGRAFRALGYWIRNILERRSK